MASTTEVYGAIPKVINGVQSAIDKALRDFSSAERATIIDAARPGVEEIIKAAKANGNGLR